MRWPDPPWPCTLRNIFDQYKQPENQLTHALASSLAEDSQLARRFLTGFLDLKDTPKTSLKVNEQSLPGDSADLPEEEAERRGLPDAVIHDGENWCLLLETKVQAKATADQLHRHYRSVRRRGFENVRVVLLTARDERIKLPKFAEARRWRDLYIWLVNERRRSVWAGRVTDFLEIMEAKLVDEGYLTEGALTSFSGFQFGPDRPYSYGEAKRLLRLAIQQLRTSKRLEKALGMDPKGFGRPAITGKDASSVWDFIPLKAARSAKVFTEFPHLTLSVQQERVLAIVTIPNRLKPRFRRSLTSLGRKGFFDLFQQVTLNLSHVLNAAPGSSPRLEALQRHYLSRRSEPVRDAVLEFDLRTATADGQAVKNQPQWLDAVYGVLSNMNSNYQLAVGIAFPYQQCTKIREVKALDLIEETWLRLAPLIDAILER